MCTYIAVFNFLILFSLPNSKTAVLKCAGLIKLMQGLKPYFTIGSVTSQIMRSIFHVCVHFLVQYNLIQQSNLLKKSKLDYVVCTGKCSLLVCCTDSRVALQHPFCLLLQPLSLACSVTLTSSSSPPWY